MTPEEKFASATREQLLAVVKAADARWRCLAEFIDTATSPGAPPCGEYEEALDKALEKCPGSTAWNRQNISVSAHLKPLPAVVSMLAVTCTDCHELLSVMRKEGESESDMRVRMYDLWAEHVRQKHTQNSS